MRMSPKRLFLILVILVVILGATTFYFYTKSKVVDQNLVTQAEAKDLAEKVGELIVLPTDEIPTIATVSDPEALKDQPFFADAKKGDKVLIYTNARTAILYDPVANKIVNVAPLNIGADKAKAPSATTPPQEKGNF